MLAARDGSGLAFGWQPPPKSYGRVVVVGGPNLRRHPREARHSLFGLRGAVPNGIAIRLHFGAFDQPHIPRHVQKPATRPQSPTASQRRLSGLDGPIRK